MMKMIECKDATKIYGRGVTGVNNVSLTIEEGEFVYLLGASGSGKSSLLKLLYREEKVSKGTIKVCGYDVTKLKSRDLYKLRREIGIVFQNFKLLPHKTVYENVAFALETIGMSEEECQPRIWQTLTLVELADKASSYPHELSGGQQQRVAIARAIVNEPKLLIADEPTGNLDPRTSREIFRLLYRINRRGTTVLLATHDREIVENFRFRMLKMHEGSLIVDEPKKAAGSLQYDYEKKDFYIV